ncbi:MAG TPA: hypothetical protein VFX70_06405 [Mycobacteriales bacterium]|nr:hypothetical protein [Mycobacteriales bacterium]
MSAPGATITAVSTLDAGTAGFRLRCAPARSASTWGAPAARFPELPWHAIWSDATAALCGEPVINVGRPWLDPAGPGPWCLECVALARCEPAWPGAQPDSPG